MRIYLMARYGRRQEMLNVAADLEALGHTVVSRWIRGDHELQDELLNTDPEFRNREGARFAQDDLEDLLSANCAIGFTEEPGARNGRGRGGRHIEAGVALMCAHANGLFLGGSTGLVACGPTRLILVGHKENVFYCIPHWEHYPDWPACREALREVAP